MTDKQIIIDGVDVSECTRYCADNGKCTAFKSQYLCSERNNCYTKRILKKNKTINILKEKLLRKEQECERLKHDNGYEVGALERTIDNLKAENEELKEEIKKHNDDMFKNPPEKRFYCKGCTLPYISKKLKQTLTEIKEIAEHCIKQDICTFCDYSDRCYIEDEEIPTYDVCKLILQKISEVEDEYNG